MDWVDEWANLVMLQRAERYLNRGPQALMEKHMARKAKQEAKKRMGGLSIREAATAAGISEDEMRQRLGRPRATNAGVLSKEHRAKLVERASEEGCSVNALVDRLLGGA